MTLLNQYLHRLFLDHDCVVVPGLGGFVCNRKASFYDEHRGELVPPSRGILFNQELVHHDGVLVHTVAQGESITMDFALEQISSEAAAIKLQITSGKTVSIEHVGRLYAGANGRIRFMADVEMEKMLQSFGLRRIPLLPQAHLANPIDTTSGGKIRPLPAAANGMRWSRIAAAIAVPVLGGAALFYSGGIQESSALMSAFSWNVTPAEYQPRFEGEGVPKWSDVEVLDEELNESAPSIPEFEISYTPAEQKAAVTTVDYYAGSTAKTDEETAMFMLVAGAFSVESNAVRLAKKLRSEGFDSEVFLQDGGLHIVTYATHLEEESARKHLNVLRAQKASKSAWMKPWKVVR